MPTLQSALTWAGFSRREGVGVEVAVDRLLTVSDVGEALSVSRRTAYRLLQEDRVIPSVRVRGSVRVRLSDLNTYIQSLGAESAA